MSEKIETVAGKQATVHFEARKCIHSRHCVLDRPDVFVPNVEGEWIHPDRCAEFGPRKTEFGFRLALHIGGFFIDRIENASRSFSLFMKLETIE